jgi:carbon storage regulator CsrA
MLCLSRHEGGRVILTAPGHGEIVVQVLGIDRGKVMLGFVAPPSVKIMRAELVERPPTGERPGVM